jgi:ribosomal protein S24E
MERWLTDFRDSDILHPNRANISKEELRDKLAGMYKAQKDQVSVFGLRTQFGGGKTTGFALVYDSPEAMKKFEPHYRLVRVGLATKIEKASRQQRTCPSAIPPVRESTRDFRWLTPTQASSARTGRRLCAARRRSRAPSRRRRNKRLAFLFGVVCYTGYLGGRDDGCGFVHYPGPLVASGTYDAVDLQPDFMTGGVMVGVSMILAHHSIQYRASVTKSAGAVTVRV